MRASTLVRAIRHEAGLSQRELAVRAGVPQSSVARIESETIDPRTATVDRLLRAAGYEVVAQPRPGAGVDRSQIHERLRLSPRQRVEEAAAAAGGLERLQRRRRR